MVITKNTLVTVGRQTEFHRLRSQSLGHTENTGAKERNTNYHLYLYHTSFNRAENRPTRKLCVVNMRRKRFLRQKGLFLNN